MSSAKYKKIYCGNCGKNGHIYKECQEPITSLGIIGYKNINGINKYILIQRKHSYGYVEFVRGKYNLKNIKYINHLFNEMSKNEIKQILNNNFDDIWNSLWNINDLNNIIFKNEYENSKKLYNNFLKIKNKIKLETKWDGPEWGFPKGRRNINENNKNCAIREFCEETNLDKNDFKINNNIYPMSEIFVGSNNVRYKHIYYIAESNNIEIDISDKNIFQKNEISKIGWFSYTDAINLFRTYNIEKKNLLTKLEKILNNIN